ncbi:hypothetical protein VTI74DRAFT_6663 [Chaetomium olivicolor]
MNPIIRSRDIETCYKYGKQLVDFYQKWQGADEALTERMIAIELHWMDTTEQLRVVQELYPSLDDAVRRMLENTMAVLVRKLDLAVLQVQKLQDPSSAPRPGFLHFHRKAKGAKYALLEGSLNAALKELEEWKVRCSLALDLSMRDPNPGIDKGLKESREIQHKQVTRGGVLGAGRGRRHGSPLSLTGGIREALQPPGKPPSVFLPNASFETSAILFSRARTAWKRSSTKATRWFILDTLPCRPGTNHHALNNDVRELAQKLKRADPFAFGLLNCKGIMRVFKEGPQVSLVGFNLVFNGPEQTDPEQLQSLRVMLLVPNGTLSLSRRVRLAQELAISVSYVHTFNFVHKNICPESVLIFKEGLSAQLDRAIVSTTATSTTITTSRRSSFLIGFESFRSASGATNMMGDQDWAHNIYRHPDRMGEYPAEEYKMQHDIYSLGVCLLEIGLWEPLVIYSSSGVNPTPEYSSLVRNFISTKKYWSLFKDYLVVLAQTELPRRMGNRYTDVVITCLTSLDPDGEFGEQGDISDTNGILVGVRFIEAIFEQLNEIVL